MCKARVMPRIDAKLMYADSDLMPGMRDAEVSHIPLT